MGMEKIRRKDSVIIRHIHENIFLIDTKCNYENNSCIFYEINEMGEFIWEHLSGWMNLEDAVYRVINDLVGEYDYDEASVTIEEYIKKLIKIGYIESEE